MKYIDAEKLKKSIGNYLEGARAALNPTDGDADYYKGKIDACKDMQELVTSLQQEQPEVDEPEYGPYARQYPKSKVSQEQSEVDLEKEIDEWLKAGPITDTRYSDYCDEDIKETARHFYELGLNARKK